MESQTDNIHSKLSSFMLQNKRQKTMPELKSEIMMSIPPLLEHASNGCM
jgi:hypothetical protein